MLLYQGFSPVAGGRSYSFSWGKTGLLRRFTVFVGDSYFRPGGLRFQDAPDACYRKLSVALEGEDPEETKGADVSLNQDDLTAYREATPNKARTWTEQQRANARLRAKANREK